MKKIVITIIISAFALVLIGTGVFFYLQTRPEKDYSFNYDPGTFFVTDIQESRRLLKTDIIIAMADSRELEFYLENNHRIRNTILFVLRNKDEEELMKANIEQLLNKELISELNREFDTGDFIQVYFNEFVIQ